MSHEFLMSFQQFDLHPSLVRNTLTLGYVHPTPVQTQAIPAIRAGRDVVATAQTGTGKTAAFLLPVLHQLLEGSRGATRALVLTPTRELAQQIETVMRGLAAGTGLRSALVIGGAPAMPQERALRAGFEVVVATPGRLLDHLRKQPERFAGLRTLILDEADQMFDMGFLPDLKRIISLLPARRQTLMFSATMPPAIAHLGAAILHNPLTVSVGQQGAAAPNVTQTAYPVAAHLKTALLTQLLEEMETPSVLVFTRTKHGARRLAKAIAASGHRVEELHSNRTPAQRLRTMQGFRAKRFSVLVATNIAARGLDVRHITHVVNFDVPDVPEEYVHRIGRTGRADAEGDALVLVSPDEERTLARIERQLGKRIARRRLPDFDYNVKPERAASGGKQRRPAPVPASSHGHFARGGKHKFSRGQGRR
jgi:ATP-dependent RNA helicase RhlE